MTDEKQIDKTALQTIDLKQNKQFSVHVKSKSPTQTKEVWSKDRDFYLIKNIFQ